MAETLHIARVGLGSNLGDRAANLRRALDRLHAQDGIRVTAASSFYETAPVGKTDQPDFLNACCEVETRRAPRDLMALLLFVESEMGRVRAERWGPRVIDLDLLLFDDLVESGEDLTVPHPEMHRRAFVLVPLAEIAPDAVHPALGVTIAALAESAEGKEGVRRFG